MNYGCFDPRCTRSRLNVNVNVNANRGFIQRINAKPLIQLTNGLYGVSAFHDACTKNNLHPASSIVLRCTVAVRHASLQTMKRDDFFVSEGHSNQTVSCNHICMLRLLAITSTVSHCDRRCNSRTATLNCHRGIPVTSNIKLNNA